MSELKQWIEKNEKENKEGFNFAVERAREHLKVISETETKEKFFQSLIYGPLKLYIELAKRYIDSGSTGDSSDLSDSLRGSISEYNRKNPDKMWKVKEPDNQISE